MKDIFELLLWVVLFVLRLLSRYSTGSDEYPIEIGVGLVVIVLVLWAFVEIRKLHSSKPD